ncbi:hypothetical protein [Aliivibrio fischeri]|uniref:hypothetical protein n=1 Tax=Aliivibrio fischeri TaxID=668 RepID=UPI0012DA59CA|nr:hypothetical protein [Aliivibrio fischeri]MUJ39707.1 hypothetical protein [Aliivibrio fischeri]
MNILELLIYVIFSSVLVATGIIVGCFLSFDLPNEISIFDVVSSLGSIMAGVGTMLGVGIAIYVGTQWKVQHRLNLFSSYYEGINRFKNAVLISCDMEHSKIIENYPNSVGYSDYEIRRFSELAEETTKAYDLMSSSFSKIELQFPIKISKLLKFKKLLLAANTLKQAIGHYQPHEIDYDEYISNIKSKRNTVTAEFEVCKKSIKSYIKTT